MQKLFQKIGVALSFSPNAIPLLSNARQLMTRDDQQICIIHIAGMNDDLLRRIHDMAILSGLNPDQFCIDMQEGEPSKTIISICKEKKLDLLIMGALERENVITYYTGSIARNIMRETPCSLLIFIPGTFTQKNPIKVYTSVDYTAEGENVIRTAFHYATLIGAEEFILIREFMIPGLAMTVHESIKSNDSESIRDHWRAEEESKMQVFMSELHLTGMKTRVVYLYGKQGFESAMFVKEQKGFLFAIEAPKKKLKLMDRIFQHDQEFIYKELPSSLLCIKT